MFYEDLRIKEYVIIVFALLKNLKGKADIGPHLNLQHLSKYCKSRYFNVYLHIVNHTEKIKSHPDPDVCGIAKVHSYRKDENFMQVRICGSD